MIVTFMLCISFLALFLGNSVEFYFFQYVGSVIFCLIFPYVLVYNTRYFVKEDYLNPVCFFICFWIPLIGVAGFYFSDDNPLAEYPFLWMFMCLSVPPLIRMFGLGKIIVIYVLNSLAYYFILIFFNFPEYMDALNLSGSLELWERRFSPFGTHPNLLGHVFGVAVVASFSVFFMENVGKYTKFLALFCALASVSVILACSSRGGLLASFVGVFVQVYMLYRSSPMVAKHVKALRYIFFVVLAYIAMTKGYDTFSYYLNDQLALDTKDRGLDSGMTGRIDNWPIIISYATDSVKSILIGNGLRSWDVYKYGIDTDNSYVNFIYEVGVPTFSCFVYFMIKIIIAIFKIDENLACIYGVGIVVFCLMESLVARYLLAVGNPGSLLYIFIILSVSIIKPESLFAKYRNVELPNGKSGFNNHEVV